MKIPFNKPFTIGDEFGYMRNAIDEGILRGDGPYTKRCHELLERKLGCRKVLLTHSCTAALEMAAILLDLQPGDEVVMPSYTFVSTANAFVLRGAVPVFVDIRPDTLNIDERLVEAAITPRTKAICCVHYAGVACEMDAIMDIARRHSIAVVEDAAQGVGSFYWQRPLGTIGDLGCFSFHETKNVICGEGGALVVNNGKYVKRAEIIREKGTNRSQFFRGEVDKYTWVDIGSSYLPSDMVAAFLFAQLENMDAINADRMATWEEYDSFFAAYDGQLRRPIIPPECQHNAHMYYVLFPNLDKRTAFIMHMKSCGITPVFHYIPLHSAPAGLRYGRVSSEMKITDNVSDRLVRMPLYYGLSSAEMDAVKDAVSRYFV